MSRHRKARKVLTETLRANGVASVANSVTGERQTVRDLRNGDIVFGINVDATYAIQAMIAFADSEKESGE